MTKKSMMLVPIGHDVGLPTIRLGLMHAIASRGIDVSFFQPIEHDQAQHACTHPAHCVMSLSELERYLRQDQLDQVLEKTLQAFEQQTAAITLVHGLIDKQSSDFALTFNTALAQALDATIIFVTAPGHHSAASLSNRVEIAARQYQRAGCTHILGCIINKVFAPVDAQGSANLSIGSESSEPTDTAAFNIELSTVKWLAKIPWQPILIAPRLSDIAPLINATIIHRGDMQQRRVHNVSLCARNVHNMVDALKAGTLIITAGDRNDIIMAAALAAMNGTPIAGLLLTGGYTMDANIHTLCQQAFQSGLPILSVNTDSFRTCQNLQNITLHTPADDTEKQHMIENLIGQHLQGTWLDEWLAEATPTGMNQAAFRHRLLQSAMQSPRHIILPEGDEPRVLSAACRCHAQGIAKITLLGTPEKIAIQAAHLGLDLPNDIQILDPERVHRDYIEDLIALRAHKGMNHAIAQEQLSEQPLVLASMMLQRGEVDGLVAGARNPTANVLRPALQLIQTAPDASKVSSIFFMCFPNQVLVFGDCAVNPNPDKDLLAEIAIQSAQTAQRFGIEPKVAMISYSTGDSAVGEEVERVRAATALVKEKMPDLIIDGPLQYDAAIIPAVAEKKAPDSPLAGQATVLIFPDLNTGNTTYKAVQRSANLLCIGPVLQGLNKPVNDLSRGATVEDIMYTIALTARQAQ